MRLGRRHSCAITHWLKGITVNIWYCGSGKFATPTLPKALRNSGSWIYYLRWPSEVTGGRFFPPSLFRQKPLQPQVCYSLSTLCSFVWGSGRDGMEGGAEVWLVGVGDTCYCCSTGICHRNGMSCQTERPFPAVGLLHRDAAWANPPGTTMAT